MADNTVSGKRKRSKAFYVGQKRKKKGQELLAPGMKGVLVTCNQREKLCVREAYNLLNEYADQLYGPEHDWQGDHNSSDDDDDDVESALAKEVEELKGTVQEKRFQAVLSGANNVIFIKTNLPDSRDPTDLVHTILMDMLKTGCKKTRHCQRFLPIAGSCHADNEDIKKLSSEMFKSTFFAEDAKPSKFCIIYKSRNNSNLDRDDTIAMLAGLVMSAGKGHKVNLNNPDLAICVEIIKNVCCMSVVRDLFKLRKYNIHEINEQIHKSQNGSKMEDRKISDQATKSASRTLSEDDTLSITVVNHACIDVTKVHEASGESEDNKETQGHSDELLNRNASHINSVTKEPRDEGKSPNCQDQNMVK